MLRRRRILLVGGTAAIAAFGVRPAPAVAGTLSCDPWFPPGWVFQFTCGDMVGCYRWGLEYGTFDCFSNTPAGNGCDADGCFIGS